MLCQGLAGIFSLDGPSGLVAPESSLNRPESAVKRSCEGVERLEMPRYAAFSAGESILAKFAKNSSAYFLATPLMSRPPSWAIFPPT